MTFQGGLDGCAFLVFPHTSAARLLSAVTGDDAGGDDMDSLRSGALTEVGNILINSGFEESSSAHIRTNRTRLGTA